MENNLDSLSDFICCHSQEGKIKVQVIIGQNDETI